MFVEPTCYRGTLRLPLCNQTRADLLLRIEVGVALTALYHTEGRSLQ